MSKNGYVANRIMDAPPADVSAEGCLLGCCIVDNSIITYVASLLQSPGVWYSEKHRLISRAILELHLEGHPVDAVTVGERLHNRGHILDAGGAQYLVELASVPTTAGWKSLKSVVEKRHAERRLREIGHTISDTVRDGVENPTEEFDAIVDRLRDVQAMLSGQQRAKRFSPMSSREFADTKFNLQFAVNGILVKGQPCIIGGKQKTLKTSNVVDLAISLDTGIPFLGRFSVQNRGRVLVMTGESGLATIQDTVRRICRAKNFSFHQLNILWEEKLPNLCERSDLDELRAIITGEKIDYVIIDPLYLALSAAQDDMPNLYAMGSRLRPLSDLAIETGVTPIVCHHLKKSSGQNPDEVPGLEDLAGAGIAEWARQWVTFSRRSEFDPETGRHELWMGVGGSAGHSGKWAVDVEEGVCNDDLSGRRWDVEIRKASEVRAEKAQAKADAKRDEQQERVMAALKAHPQGESKNVLREYASMSGSTFSKVITDMVNDGLVTSETTTKANKLTTIYRLKGPVRTPGQGADCPDLSALVVGPDGQHTPFRECCPSGPYGQCYRETIVQRVRRHSTTYGTNRRR